MHTEITQLKLRPDRFAILHTNAIPKNQTQVDINDINEQYLAEFIGSIASSNQSNVC